MVQCKIEIQLEERTAQIVSADSHIVSRVHVLVCWAGARHSDCSCTGSPFSGIVRLEQ